MAVTIGPNVGSYRRNFKSLPYAQTIASAMRSELVFRSLAYSKFDTYLTTSKTVKQLFVESSAGIGP